MFGTAAELRGVTPDPASSSNLTTVHTADNTVALQSALNSTGVITLTKPGTYTLLDTFTYPANTILMIAPGVTLQTSSGGAVTTLASITVRATGTAIDLAGNIAGTVGVNVGRTEPIQRSYRFVNWGDSRASFMTTSTLLAVTGSGTGLNDARTFPWLVGSLGDCEAVANFGVSGDTAALWAASNRANSKTINNLVSASLFKGGPVQVCYVQLGINDYVSGASAATTAGFLKALCTTLMSAGIKVVFEATNPADAATYGASSAAKLQATIDGNALMKTFIAGFPRQAVFVDTFSSLIDATGFASTTYFVDGLHFNRLGAMLSGKACAAAARTILPQKFGLIYTSGSLLQPNLIDRSALSSGAGLYTVSDVGTVTFSTPTWNIETSTASPQYGMPYAEVTATAAVLSSGRATGHLEVHANTIAGATPRFPLSIGDELQGTAFVTIDNGAGGIAPIQSALFRHRAYFDTKFADVGQLIGAAGTTFNNAIAHRFTTPTFFTATASGAIAAPSAGAGYPIQQHVEFNTVGQVARIRVYAPSLRVVSVGGSQPTQPAVGASPYTFTNTTGAPLVAYVGGGTVSIIGLARQGTAFTTGLISGTFRLAQNDQIVITYSSAPTFTVMSEEQSFL